MSFLRFTSLLFLCLFLCTQAPYAQHQTIKSRQQRQIKQDSIREKLKRLADSIYELNGGKPAIPPGVTPSATTPEPVKELQEITRKSPQITPLYWVAGGAILLIVLLFILTRRKKGQG